MATSTKSFFVRGMRDGAPFMLVVAPFGMLFGVVATEAGLNLAEVMGMTALVIAGAAQFTALAMMSDNAPTLVVIAAALAVNLRMAMYSATLTPYLGSAPLWKRAIVAYCLVDQTYALGALKFEAKPDMTLSQRLAYFFGTATPMLPLWYIFTLLGSLFGTLIPDALALDFAVPITFLAILGPAMRTLAHVVAAAVSVAAALALAWLPFNLGLLVAALLAMHTGATVELWVERRS